MINEELNKQLEQRAYNRNYNPPPEDVTMTIQGKVCATLENIIVFTGLPKAGKSSFLTAAICSAFMTYSLFDIKISLPQNRRIIGYFDTESSTYDFYKTMERIKTNMGANELPLHFQPFTLRDAEPAQIKVLIEYYLTQLPQCSMLFIDGLLDCLNNYNDETESRLLITWLKKITTIYKITIVGVVHIGKKDNNTLGHFGSMVDRYSQSVLIVERDTDKNLFTLKPKFMRSDLHFNPISLTNNAGKFEQVF